MNLDPSYLAAFRGPGSNHPVHPNNVAWHEQYVTETGALHEHIRTGFVTETGEAVYAYKGAWTWYLADDLRRLTLSGSSTPEWRVLAELIP